MKKLFALVLVLAMALAIAVPTLAAGWDDISVAPKTTGITVDVMPLATSTTTGFGGTGYYKELTAAELGPIVKGSLVHFVVTITIPNNLSAADKKLLETKGLDYELSLKNLTLGGGTASAKLLVYTTEVDTGYSMAAYVNAEEATFQNAGGADWTNRIIVLEYWATAKANGEAKATADISFNNKWVGSSFGWDNDADGIDEFEVVTFTDGTGNWFIIRELDADGVFTDNALWIPVDGKKVDEGRVFRLRLGSTFYAVSQNTSTEAITFSYGAGLILTGTEHTDALKVFNKFFKALGFEYKETKYMTEDHFTKYFGPIASGTDSVTYAPGAIIVDPNAPKPPQTGDATTVVGFVMIALALIAAAAVTVKKVRA